MGKPRHYRILYDLGDARLVREAKRTTSSSHSDCRNRGKHRSREAIA